MPRRTHIWHAAKRRRLKRVMQEISMLSAKVINHARKKALNCEYDQFYLGHQTNLIHCPIHHFSRPNLAFKVFVRVHGQCSTT
jgi:hypothetical protein